MRILTVLILSVFISAMAAAQEYGIKFDRPHKAGDKYKLIASGTDSKESSVFSNGEMVKSANQLIAINFEGEITILEVNENGRTTKESITVEKCLLRLNGQESSPLEKGTVITASPKGTKTIYEINGQPIDKTLGEALSLVEKVYTGALSDDEVFGTKEKKKAGDTWSINTDKIPEDIKRHGMIADQKNISGSTKFEKVEKSGDIECLSLSGEMTIKDFSFPVPPNSGLKVEQSAMMVAYTGLFPTNMAIPRIEESMETKAQISLSGRQKPDAPELKIINTAEQKFEHKYTWEN
ncbi:MAG TPA: hypothetical protein DCZ94_12615 [Lentisphaeria bacterium]|nr:MAG: hypothetical protein A2X48_21305 [Lentisphaerae bacterium GWF2_49_21]HBC87789.1 hypothetical protein [Lentisphaeria bacterium]